MLQKLFLIDGSALYYRSYFAFIRNPLINSKGENTSATFGFLSALVRLIEDEQPDYLAVVFDTKEPTFRHKLFPEYKATRERMPDEMIAQYPRLITTLRQLNFTLIEKEGYEADDIIGTLVKSYAAAGLLCYIVSGDKDMAQLVTEHVFLYNPGKANQAAEILNKQGVKQKLGIDPEQVVDWLALMGDSSDNIPGIPKIGNKTAVSLLSTYNTISGLYDHIRELKEGAVKENLLSFRDQTQLAIKLAEIDTQVPLDIALADLKFTVWDIVVLDTVLKELEFRRLYDRMKAIAQKLGVVEHFSQHEEDKVKYTLVQSWDQFEQLYKEWQHQKEFCFDLETSSLDFLEAEIAGIAVSWQENNAYYIPLQHPDIQLDCPKVLERLRPIFADKTIRKIGQNIKFDVSILKEHHVKVEGIYFDTMIASYLINPAGQHNLDKLSEYYLNYEMIHIEELIGSGSKQKLMTEIPAKEVARYAAEDADIAFKLYHLFKPKIKELGMEELFYNLEIPLIEVLMEMEHQGIRLDIDLLEALSKKLAKEIKGLQREIFEAAKEEFNLNSPVQLGNVLFDKLEIHKELNRKKPPKTKTGQYSTSENILERYIQHPLVANIMNFRKLSKLQNTYLEALPKLVSKKTGHVHTSYNQTVAATGRLSSSNPNLQNIPIRTEIGREIRKAFIPSRSDYKILSADYSQIELRIMAHLSADKTMVEAFKNNLDIHAATAALIFNLPAKEVSAEHRRKAKEINFGIIYGMSAYGLASRLNISTEEAEEFIRDYMATYPDVQAFMKKSIELARSKGFVETIMNRRRYLPEIKSENRQIREFAERTAINTPIQGSAADLIKMAMIDIHRYIEGQKIDAHLLLQVHDELVFEVNSKSVDKFKTKILSLMENAVKLKVPLKVECGIGNNWLEAH